MSMLKTPYDYLDRERAKHLYWAIELIVDIEKSILKEFPEYDQFEVSIRAEHCAGMLGNDETFIAHTWNNDGQLDYAGDYKEALDDND